MQEPILLDTPTGVYDGARLGDTIHDTVEPGPLDAEQASLMAEQGSVGLAWAATPSASGARATFWARRREPMHQERAVQVVPIVGGQTHRSRARHMFQPFNRELALDVQRPPPGSRLFARCWLRGGTSVIVQWRGCRGTGPSYLMSKRRT